MEYNLCSISFRHELISFQELVEFASTAGFDGIELWGVHAKALARYKSQFDLERLLREHSVKISMLSGYIDTVAQTEFERSKESLYDLINTAHQFGTNKIRIFAGIEGSSEASSYDWDRCINNLNRFCEISKENGITLLIETHPQTFADNLESTIRIINQVNHNALKINLDILHLWETGENITRFMEDTLPFVANYHLKNITSLEAVDTFLPQNIYSPNGNTNQLCSLAEGTIDYKEVIHFLVSREVHVGASLEWFGQNPKESIIKDLRWIQSLEERYRSNHAMNSLFVNHPN